MTLDEVAGQLAEGLSLARAGGEGDKVRLEGRQAVLWLGPFFGGWQIVVELPGRPRYQFFEEDVRMMIQRIDARLKHFAREQEEMAQRKRPGR